MAVNMSQPIHMVIPFKCQGAKSRLSAVLSPKERRLLAFAMLKDVLATVSGLGRATVLSRSKINAEEVGCNVEILASELDLNDALNSMIFEEASHGWPLDILIVMADLALLTEKDVAGIINCQGDVVLCPGRGGGTNMILIRSPDFRTCYRGLSFPKHLAYARQAGLSVSTFESFRAGCDIDEPQDLAEVLLHGQGEAKRVLEEMGFSLSQNGRSCLERRSG